VMDDKSLRAAGIALPGEALLEPEREALVRAIGDAQMRLALLAQAPAPRAPRSRARRLRAPAAPSCPSRATAIIATAPSGRARRPPT